MPKLSTREAKIFDLLVDNRYNSVVNHSNKLLKTIEDLHDVSMYNLIGAKNDDSMNEQLEIYKQELTKALHEIEKLQPTEKGRVVAYKDGQAITTVEAEKSSK